jgi:serine/threonine protein kinase
MPARDDIDPLVGQIIDRRYRVISRIGDGGMGIVYKVEHSYLNKLFALKVMRPTKDEVDRKRFEQEARLASSIRHANVVEISDFGVLPTDQPYYVMEFLRGHTLGDAICAGQLDPLLACHIGAQICSGLQAVHRQNVVHRDLKPDNIFLVDPDAAAPAPTQQSADATAGQGEDQGTEVRFVKIMDFGIAKSIDNRLTGAGMTVGTPEYMSPEQAQGERIDWRSDQYSLGCILYEMLTGSIPFDGKGAFEIMTKQLQAAPVPPRQRCPERAAQITPELEQLVLRMMAKKKDQRIASMRQIETTLRQQATLLLAERMKTFRLPAAAVQTVLMPPRGGSQSQAQQTVRMQAVGDSNEMPTRNLHAIGPDGRPSMKTRQMDISEHAEMQKLIHKIQDKISVPSLPETPAWYRYPIVLSAVRWLHAALEWLRRKLGRPPRS